MGIIDQIALIGIGIPVLLIWIGICLLTFVIVSSSEISHEML